MTQLYPPAQRSSTLDLDAAAAAQGDGSLLTVGSNALSMHGGTEPADVTSSVDSKSALVNTGPAAYKLVQV